MQDHLVFSTFSRARNSVISRTRKAFTPRGLIKETGESPDCELTASNKSVTQDDNVPPSSEPTYVAPDRIDTREEEEIRVLLKQISKLEEKITSLEKSKTDHIASSKDAGNQIAELEQKVKKLEVENHGWAEKSTGYVVQIETLEDDIKVLRRDEADHTTRIKEYEIQLEQRGKQVGELRTTQLRLDDSNKSIVQLQEKLALRDRAFNDRTTEMEALKRNIGQLQDQTEDQHKMIESQRQDIENLETKITTLLAESEGQKKTVDLRRDELRTKDTTIDQLQADFAEAKTELAKHADMLSNMPPQLPESDIIVAWRSLADNVERFVSENFGVLEFKQVRRWIRAQGIERVPEHAAPAIAGDVYTSRFVEAAIWNILNQLVFAESILLGGMCWAGRYTSRVTKLSKFTSKAIATLTHGVL